MNRKARKSKLYDMKLFQKVKLKEYDYGVSHISKRTGRSFIQRKTDNGFICMRIK